MPDRAPALEAVDLEVHYPIHSGRSAGKTVRALEATSLALHAGRIVALVGESGSGKTTLARALAMAQRPTGGSVRLGGEEVSVRGRRGRREYASRVQLVLQDPFGSLNPLHRVRYLLERPLKLHGEVTGAADLDQQLRGLLERVRLTPVEQFIDKYPHELSGGQRQRVAIARALAVRPDVLLGDELVSMLDVSMRLEVLNLLGALRTEQSLAMLYITHDIAGARYFADEISVMYAGEMVEFGSTEAVTQNAAHPYTQLLLESSPDPDRMEFLSAVTESAPETEKDYGEPPNLIDPPAGCRFHPRCPFAMEKCSTQAPPKFQLADEDGHWMRCWLAEPKEEKNA